MSLGSGLKIETGPPWWVELARPQRGALLVGSLDTTLRDGGVNSEAVAFALVRSRGLGLITTEHGLGSFRWPRYVLGLLQRGWLASFRQLLGTCTRQWLLSRAVKFAKTNHVRLAEPAYGLHI